MTAAVPDFAQHVMCVCARVYKLNACCKVARASVMAGQWLWQSFSPPWQGRLRVCYRWWPESVTECVGDGSANRAVI